ncbi:hypothetical protein [Gracilimonas mengyeensis]|uniref:hypothetical protein n=1 Tax=Gracilimonas mengyeensis TaxID=1302730 RepID=UPI001158C1CD|nr:hypothetical protein [Gracilimonas mengyeensis]
MPEKSALSDSEGGISGGVLLLLLLFVLSHETTTSSIPNIKVVNFADIDLMTFIFIDVQYLDFKQAVMFLSTQHSALSTQHSALSTQHSKLIFHL